jgi:glycosyltransferase involved in cell wall biosynthesis
VIAARSQGPVELIADGIDGVLVPVDDAGALAGAVTALIGEPARAAALAAAGRAAWAARYAPEPVVARWRHFLATVNA